MTCPYNPYNPYNPYKSKNPACQTSRENRPPGHGYQLISRLPFTVFAMPTKLDKIIRREIEIDGEPFTVSISPDGVRLTRKRFRSGVALSWKSLWARHDGNAMRIAEGADDR